MQQSNLLNRRSSEAGLTLIELSVVLFIMSIVLVIAGTTIFSLSQTASRNDSLVTDEQQASTVLAQMSRDIRSAHQVTFSGYSSPVPTQELELQMNQPTGAWVEWVYTPSTTTVNGLTQSAHTLARYAATSSTGPFKISNPTVTKPVSVVNASTELFRYFQGNGTEITSNPNPTSIQTCTTRVKVTLVVGTQNNIPGVATFQVGDEVAITDQETQWATLPCS